VSVRSQPPVTGRARVKLSGTDGNVYTIIGRCAQAGRKAHYTVEQLRAFNSEAMHSASYDAVLQVCMKWFDVE
jgi:hypothetical protein